ncbi:flagellar hook-associated protein FlgK [Aquabacterium lacunae]|uniref:Flagellar hook-associated protein 1 n=1 Tax=Aquabacterium lacunae TaxID=2528630 RepID=A0A4V2JFU6_9BURK|nr:flagellar hook-associated protein FlgK [Aquabacterium lacunae]TBO32716.1 flagellar hook-associated protein FlgK [Aquabacterium lacunae]
MASGIFGIGTRALLANQSVLDTISHNISNANTEGYSRQEVKLATEGGRYTGAGFYGRGVRVSTVDRTTDPYLVKQMNMATAVSTADSARLDKLKQLEKVFATGENGLGFAASQMLNAFVDVANQPQDTAARQVVLARAEDYATRMRTAATQLNELQAGVTSDLGTTVATVNSIAKSIAQINDQIAKYNGTGQSPNDLLDQRDQLINDLNEQIQVTTIAADDGTMGVFIGGGQRLVLGNEAETLTLKPDEYDSAQSRLYLTSNGNDLLINDRFLSGGAISGLMRVQNEDIPAARNLLGQMAASLSWRINQQQSFGLDLRNPPQAGANLFTDPSQSMQVLPSSKNTSSLSTPPVSLTLIDGRQLRAEDYMLKADPTNPSTMLLTRSSDPSTSITVSDGSVIDGFRINFNAALVGSQDSFKLRPVGEAALAMEVKISLTNGIAAASPFVATATPGNKGSASVSQMSVSSTPSPAMAPTQLQVVFTSNAGDYNIEFPPGTPISTGVLNPTQPITYNGFQITGALNRVPALGETFGQPAPLQVTFTDNLGNYQLEFPPGNAIATGTWQSGHSISYEGFDLGIRFASTPAAGTQQSVAAPLQVNFTSDNGHYDLEYPPGTPVASGQWVQGQPIAYNGFELSLNGVPRNGDKLTVQQTQYVSTNNGNALALLDLRDEDLVGRVIADANQDGLDDNGLPPSRGANITDAYSQIIGSIGVRVQGAQTSANISQTIASNAKETLTARTGVNLDEEAARMIQYQQAYQAAAKVLQIAQSIFDTLLQTARG